MSSGKNWKLRIFSYGYVPGSHKQRLGITRCGSCSQNWKFNHLGCRREFSFSTMR